jgi:hypothetical protein
MYRRFTLHVPLQRNDGSTVEDDILALIESDLLDIGGGFTAVDAVGAWRGDGTTYREPVRLFHVDTDDPEASGLLHALARAVARWLDQEAVYLTAADLTPSLVAWEVPA